MVSQLHARNLKLQKELHKAQSDLASIQQAVMTLHQETAMEPKKPNPLPELRSCVRSLPTSHQHMALTELLNAAINHGDRSPSFTSIPAPSLTSQTSQHSNTTSDEVTLQQLQAAIVAASMLQC